MLASELSLLMEVTESRLRSQLSVLRGSVYRDLMLRQRNLEQAIVAADSEQAVTLSRLRTRLLDQLAMLEERQSVIDVTAQRLSARREQVKRAIAAWGDRQTVQASSREDCQILMDGFVALFADQQR